MQSLNHQVKRLENLAGYIYSCSRPSILTASVASFHPSRPWLPRFADKILFYANRNKWLLDQVAKILNYED